MDDLFAHPTASLESKGSSPLAARLRPRTLDEVLGQEHLLAPGKPLRRLIETDRLSSILLFGPPGVGKTTLAEIIAHHTQSRFERLNAVESTVADLRRLLTAANQRYSRNEGRTLLFIDEIHRFNKAQQDALLPDVENGAVRLIGATTHNPSFYVNGPLVSRSQIFELNPLTEVALSALIDLALHDTTRGLGASIVDLRPEARTHLLHIADGDARRLLNSLELAVTSTAPNDQGEIIIDLATMEDCVQRKRPLYDRGEDQHYDTISAFIKSVRGSDPDAAIYWLAKMIVAGEEPLFLARRLVILAAEDIGMADPQALPLAVAAQQAVSFLGMPEGRIPLAEATIYLATAAKSNAAYMALNEAMAKVEQEKTISVPAALRDSSTSVARKLGHGAGYQYSHDHPEAISGQSYGVEPFTFYRPTTHGYEKTVKERLDRWVQLKRERS